MKPVSLIIGTLALAALATGASAQDATYSIRLMTPDTALKAAQAALKSCRDSGYQVAVAVVDRGGVTQVLLRDRYAGAHTPSMAADKAWTAVSFRTNTTDLARLTAAGQPQSGVRHRPRVATVGGGLIIEGGGAILGGIGVSGAPGGEADDACANAGIAAIRESIEF
jgi:uncharacterized protein GlcG (DUF336 family)